MADGTVVNGNFRGAQFVALYYSHNRGPKAVLSFCWETLKRSVREAGGRLIAVTWEPVAGADANSLILAPHASHKGIYNQIMQGLAMIDDAPGRETVVCLCEHDVLYPPEYFDEMVKAVRSDPAALHYNRNVWHLDDQGFYRVHQAFHFLSNCSGQADVLAGAIRNKADECVKNGRVGRAEPEGETCPVKDFESCAPVIDIRHGQNFTGPRKPQNGPPVQTLAPWGNAGRYAFLWKAPGVGMAIPGMSAAAPARAPKIVLASCCEFMRHDARQTEYTYARVDGRWAQIGWVPVAQVEGKTTWRTYAIPARFCQCCGGALDDKTPTRPYPEGAWSPIDASAAEFANTRVSHV